MKQKKGEIKIFLILLIGLLFVVVGSAGFVSADGIDEYTKLMLHLDGTDDSTTDADFIDSSASEHTVSQEGNAKLENTEKKFGVTSGYFDGVGDYLTIPDSDDWDFGTGDFTIDFWVKPIDGTNTMIYERWASGGQQIVIMLENNYLLFHNARYSLSTTWLTSNTTVPLNVWSHIAVIRSGDNFNTYINGSSVASGTQSGDLNSHLPLHIGTYGSVLVTYDYNGYLDELRITKGLARWTENFTPDTSPYSEEGFGNLTTYWVTPVTDTNVQQNEFFKVQIGVNCTGGECGDVNVTLDPEEVKKAIEDYKAQQDIITGEVVEEVEDEMNFFEMILDFIKGVFGR